MIELHQEGRRRLETVGDAVDEIIGGFEERWKMRNWIGIHGTPAQVSIWIRTLKGHVRAYRELREFPREIPFDDVLFRRESSE